jgi:hypothetical protein
MPGRAALDALKIAKEKYPALGKQELIDKLVICGLSALLHQHWQPPSLYGKDRDKWPPLPPSAKC